MFSIEIDRNQPASAFYHEFNQLAEGLISAEADPIAGMANLSSLLFNVLDDVNWAGFYLMQEEQLVLGPFHGQPACTRIPLGRGVCGTAASENAIQRIADVDAFPGHISCDAASQSEIVLPLLHDGKVVAVLDIDSPVKERFTEEDEKGLIRLVELIQDGLHLAKLS
ncbi:GAF domain-containing protein [Sansalvadorimonas verongulae]|uniref:GAF domain-containing protein n=1 Tax=Sansalvadorimonas verongulae TaxID=2172824 RepID=UPI0012BBF753|nr:GAF domain-containing protein [Sansalvadorimonas verongulae]MTI12030.1 GAF domain-containing protein [Sansalvadorimonas verongulae]